MENDISSIKRNMQSLVPLLQRHLLSRNCVFGRLLGAKACYNVVCTMFCEYIICVGVCVYKEQQWKALDQWATHLWTGEFGVTFLLLCFQGTHQQIIYVPGIIMQAQVIPCFCFQQIAKETKALLYWVSAVGLSCRRYYSTAWLSRHPGNRWQNGFLSVPP